MNYNSPAVKTLDWMAEGVKRVLGGTAVEQHGRRAYRWLRRHAARENRNDGYDRLTYEIMDRCLTARSNAIDVGAHKGDILRQIIRRAPTGRHFAFEPLPHLYEGLVRDFLGVTVSPLALSDQKRRTTFQHAVADSAYSGLRKRTYPKGVQETLREILVETDTLDHVLPPELPIAFIKIDVEGAELEVLRGASKTLRAYHPLVVFEHGLGAADYYGTTPRAVYDFLAEHGLRISLLSDWLRSKRPLTQEGFVREFTPRGHFYFLAHP